MGSVIFVEDSKNSKLARGKDKIATTYLPIAQTCSNDCNLKNKVCYAQTGFVGIHNWRLEKSAKRKSHDKIVGEEANAIRKSFNGKQINGIPLRLHVSGDCRTAKGATRLNSAASNYIKRGGGRVYTYTHSWRNLMRSRWGKNISVLASIENVQDVDLAKAKGYASAIVVESFPSDKAFLIEGKKFIPCPNQTKDISCAKCKLCFNADRLLATGANIAFSAHGSRKGNLIQLSKKIVS